MTPDVLVVGAGLAGATIGYEAARRGLRGLLVDRAPGPAEGASRWSQAGVSWLSAMGNPDLRQIAVEGLQRNRDLAEELGLETSFRPVPSLSVARSHEALERMAGLVEIGRGLGLDGQVLGAEDLADVEPALAPNVAVGAVRCQQGHVDPAILIAALLEAATRRGLETRFDVDVRGLVVDGARCLGVRLEHEVLRAGQVVLAAGAWTRTLLRTAGLAIPVLHTHAEILITRPVGPRLSHFVGVADPTRAELEIAMGAPEMLNRWDVESDAELLPAALQFGAVQFADGHIRMGQISRAVTGFRSGPDPAGEAPIRELARELFPSLADIPASLEGQPVAITADRKPLAGAFSALPNLYVATGYDSPFVYMPAIARRLAAALADESAADLAPFSPDRFAGARQAGIAK